ncbi:MAG: N-acetyltransferase family protein [Thiohalomonadaceae bacterium]
MSPSRPEPPGSHKEHAEVSIRAATPADIPALTALLAALFALESDFAPDGARQRAGLAALLASPQARVFVAEAGQGVIGMCTVQVLISTAQGGRVGLVEDVIVRNGWRGRGVGRALLAALEDWARGDGLSRLQLLANVDNRPAHDFYRKSGWSETRLGAWRRFL